jgi:hypothetical protein
MCTAADWIRTSAGSHDRFFLLVDEFDLHEPFDTPLPNAAMYNEEREGGLAIWPPYLVDAGPAASPTPARRATSAATTAPS